ncbi:hypothetical protein GGR91_001705 [Sphingorhabdus rigui]|uniref:DUF3617 domain-containing protein n=1 Tax=Sphingorhabdus rigui TaxID=1282858 RepID=A0A840B2P0_9SPHN|nr:hypothetical protein [Sphingorhabdus rigui]MBB3943447.1 hypothetical protein [Sphingorhabdus rigui]
MRIVFAIILLAAGLTTVSQKAWADFNVDMAGNPFAPFVRLNTEFGQVRVDQRIIIRLPSPASAPVAVGAQRQSVAKLQYKEKKIGKCLWVDRLGGSRPGPDRTLDLLTRDGILIRAYLGDGCLAREFYAGAYMERSFDGKLCVDRDVLHARTGAKCEIDKFRLLIPR